MRSQDGRDATRTNARDYVRERAVDQPQIMIVAEDAEFARGIVARWQSERTIPAFTLMSSELWQGARAGNWKVALVGSGLGEPPLAVLKALEAHGRPVIYVADDAGAAQAARESFPRLLVVRRHEGWVDAVVVLGSEALRHAEAVERAHKAEQAAAQLHHQATLGRYMLEMRHSLNNALTSVLGNSELLLLEPGTLSAGVRDQVDTIRNMALRMHEIIQRFSSLDAEMRFADNHPAAEPKNGTAVAARAAD